MATVIPTVADAERALDELHTLPAAVQRLPSIQKELKEHERVISVAVKAAYVADERAVKAYEEARFAYQMAQDELIGVLPMFIELMDKVAEAKDVQELATRAAKTVDTNLVERCQTISLKARLHEEPYRTIQTDWNRVRNCDV